MLDKLEVRMGLPGTQRTRGNFQSRRPSGFKEWDEMAIGKTTENNTSGKDEVKGIIQR